SGRLESIEYRISLDSVPPGRIETEHQTSSMGHLCSRLPRSLTSDKLDGSSVFWRG
ncbi:12170_t:CDS:1, partial [Rhizophagus irregularis]